MEVHVIQYMMPDGHRELRTTNLDDALAKPYALMSERGYNFAAEILRTGEVSLTIEHLDREEDFAIEVVQNGPQVIKAMGQLLARVDEKSLERFERDNPLPPGTTPRSMMEVLRSLRLLAHADPDEDYDPFANPSQAGGGRERNE